MSETFHPHHVSASELYDDFAEEIWQRYGVPAGTQLSDDLIEIRRHKHPAEGGDEGES